MRRTIQTAVTGAASQGATITTIGSILIVVPHSATTTAAALPNQLNDGTEGTRYIDFPASGVTTNGWGVGWISCSDINNAI